MTQYKLEVVKSMTAISQVYELSISLDDIIELCRNKFKSNVSLYLTDSQGNDVAYREFGKWQLVDN